MIVYRGAQRPNPGETRLGQASWTPSLAVAIVYSAVPGNIWSSSKELQSAHFLDGSTVFVAQSDPGRELRIGGSSTYTRIGDVVRALKWGEKGGITVDEVKKIFNYLVNREFGRVRGAGEFSYQVYDSDGEPREEYGLSFQSSWLTNVRDEFADYEDVDTCDEVRVDCYALADTPAVQRVATRQGFAALRYTDLFGGGESALEALLGIESHHDVEGVDMDRTLDGKRMLTHETIRPLRPLQALEALPVREAIVRLRGGR